MNDILSWAAAQDVSKLSEFLKKDNHKPLICLGSGGSTPTCRYIEMMYQANGGVAIESTLASFALFYKAFTGKHPVIPEDESGIYDTFKGVSHVIAIHGPWGEAAAWNLECQLVESGFATCSVVDFKNFCHGRFIFPAKHNGFKGTPADCMIAFFVTPREQELLAKIQDPKILNPATRHIVFGSKEDSPLATLEMLVKETQFAQNLAHDNATSSKDTLSDPYNPAGIDKRAPKQLSFPALKKIGPIKL